jgi:hypothetical protein
MKPESYLVFTTGSHYILSGTLSSILSVTSYFFQNILNLKLMLLTKMVVGVVTTPCTVAAVLVVRLI